MGHRGLLHNITRQQVAFAISALAILLLATITSTITSAASLNNRSITPSSMAVEATGVQYEVVFTPETAADAFVIEFCDNTPLLGQSCVAPVGLKVDAATTSDASISEEDTTENRIVATKEMTTAEQTITLAGITNPTNTGAVYARIVTYADLAGAQAYQSTDAGALIDNGSVALYFNDSVAVSGTVLETLEFCVSGSEITANCGGITTPTIVLGQEVTPGVFALQPGIVSEGTLHTQINTNAASGAIVRLKSSAPCGGLMRAGTDECDIVAAGENNVVANDNSARFGVRTDDEGSKNATGALNPIGLLQPRIGSIYNDTTYAFDYDENHETGVTSPFGDPFLDTNNLPATGKNMELTFAASVSTNTPAGLYSTDLSMIAVGKF